MVNQAKILFVCDKRKCDFCKKGCDHTADIKHAKNFELSGGIYIERKKKVTVPRPTCFIRKKRLGTGGGNSF